MRALAATVILVTLFPVFFWLAKTFGEGGWGGAGYWPSLEITLIPLILLLIVGAIVLIVNIVLDSQP